MARLVRGLRSRARALAHGAVPPARAADGRVAAGRWELVRSPDGDKTDWLEFAPDGRMTTITTDGRRLAGRYVDTGREVQLNYKIGTEGILITLTYGPDKAQLYARSGRTGLTAVYEKRP